MEVKIENQMILALEHPHLRVPQPVANIKCAANLTALYTSKLN